MRVLISCILFFISWSLVGQTIEGSWYSNEIDVCLIFEKDNKLNLNELESLKYSRKKNIIKVITGYSKGFLFRRKHISEFKIVEITETTLILSQDLNQKNYNSFYEYMPKERVVFIRKECTGLE